MGGHRNRTKRPGAILSRLVAILALALFLVPPGLAERALVQAGVAAENHIDQPHGIVAAQRYLQRIEAPDDDLPDPWDQAAALPALPVPVAARFSVSESADLVRNTLRILPPGRGPPAV